MAKFTETQWIWRNGEFIPWADAHIHVLSHSVEYGSAVFEGVRAYATPNGPALFRVDDHLKRLVNSCKVYRTELPYSIGELATAICELIERNKMTACYIRPMVVRGYGSPSMVPHDSPLEVYLPCYPAGNYHGADGFANGVDVCVSSWHRVAPNTIPAIAKIAGNYLASQLTKMEALANGYEEGIGLGPDGMLSEGSGQNVFVVQRGTLYTPPVDGTLLPGITRLSVLSLAHDAGIPVREQLLPREMLYTADEVFFCGTAAEITPVRSVDRLPVASGKPGPMTLQLQRTFMATAQGELPDGHGWLTYVRGAGEPGNRGAGPPGQRERLQNIGD
jgi:branched-chain amino acid aminotransferase